MVSVILWLASAVVVATLFPAIAHWLPFYNASFERAIVEFYETRDASGLLLFSWLWGYISVPQPTNRGAHFQGLLKGEKDTKGRMFFEGWYYKVVSPDLQHTMIAIPGVFFDGKSESDHAFIMTSLVGTSGKPEVEYHRFELDQVKIVNLPGDHFNFQIAGNVFSHVEATLNIPGKVTGTLSIVELNEFPATVLNPNIMGFFSYIDATVGMQCVHNVVAMDAKVSGSITYYGEEVDFSGGHLYIEGDYGSEFPR